MYCLKLCLYSVNEYLVKIAPCCFRLEHTTTFSLSGSHAVTYEFKVPGSTVKLHYFSAHTVHFHYNISLVQKHVQKKWKTSLDALFMPNWLRYAVSTEIVHMTKIHIQHQLMMPQLTTAAGWIVGNKLAVQSITFLHLSCTWQVLISLYSKNQLFRKSGMDKIWFK